MTGYQSDIISHFGVMEYTARTLCIIACPPPRDKISTSHVLTVHIVFFLRILSGQQSRSKNRNRFLPIHPKKSMNSNFVLALEVFETIQQACGEKSVFKFVRFKVRLFGLIKSSAGKIADRVVFYPDTYCVGC